MKRSWLAGVLAVALAASFANAYVVNGNTADFSAQCDADGDGAAIVSSDMTLAVDTQGDYTFTIPETVYATPAHMDGKFTQAAARSVNIWVLKDILNDTTAEETWTAYTFNIYMSQPFTISAFSQPEGWTHSPVTMLSSGPYMNLDNNGSWGYKAVVTFSATDPSYYVNFGDTISLGTKLAFTGPVDFEVEQVATVLPEPMTLALLALGGLFMARRR